MKASGLILIAWLMTSILPAHAQDFVINYVSTGARPTIAIGPKGSLFVGFEGYEHSSNASDVFVTSSADGGKTWTAPVNVSKTTGASSDPDILVEKGGAIDLVWSDTKSGDDKAEIFFSRSTDAGKTWLAAEDVSNTKGTSIAPAIAQTSDQAVNIVWQDTSTGENLPQIYYTCASPLKLENSSDKLSWLKAENVSKTPGAASEPDLVAGGDNKLRLAWIDTTSGSARPDVFYRVKEGGQWSNYVDVSHSPRISSHPSIACGREGHALVVWLDNSKKIEDPDIWAAVEKKPGHFGKAINVSDSRGVSSEPVIAANENGKTAVVWSDSSRNLANFDVVTRLSPDNLDEISATTNLSHCPRNAKLPDVALFGEEVFFVWQEREGSGTVLKSAKLSLKDIATGPSEEVDPEIHTHNRNARN